jgi:hypothetical protein
MDDRTIYSPDNRYRNELLRRWSKAACANPRRRPSGMANRTRRMALPAGRGAGRRRRAHD